MRFVLSLALISFLFVQNVVPQEQAKKSTIIETYKGASYYMHLVSKGETVQSIARLYGVTNVEILRANPEIASGLQPNQVIKVPANPTRIDGGAATNNGKQVGDSLFHTVQAGETWYGIARFYKVPVKDLISSNPSIDTLKIGMNIRIPRKTQETKVVSNGFSEHMVQQGETLYGISRQYNTTIDELKRLNSSLEQGLKVGQVLMIPSSTTGTSALSIQYTDTTYINHKVEKKETLYTISKAYGVDVNDIIKANPRFNGNLRKGDVIRIPSVTKSVKPFPKPDTVIMGRPINEQAIIEFKPVPCTPSPRRGKEYNVAMLIPMQLELIDSISVTDPAKLKSALEYVSFDFIQFYEGAIIAADSMTSIGMNVKIHVFDTDYGDQIAKTRRLLNNPQMAKMDLIIGPFFAKSFDLVANFASKEGIPIINPLSRRSEFTSGNEYVVKLQPSSWSQYTVLSKYLKSAYPTSNIVVVRRNDEENKSMAEVIRGNMSGNTNNGFRYKEINYSASRWAGLSKNLVTHKQNVVVILTSDQAMLSGLLRDLYAASETHQITVVGLPGWESLELDYNHLMKLNTHFFDPWFVDYNDPAVKHFLRVFRGRYVAEPEVDKHAFLGYDATLYFLKALNNYGSDFLKCIESFNQQGLSNDFHFYKNQGGGYENQGTSVYKFQDYKRVKLN